MPRRMNFRNRGAYRRWLAYDAIHNPRFGTRPVDVDVDGRHVKGPFAHAHRHSVKHHGGRCGPLCRRGNYTHQHRVSYTGTTSR